jgi:hypothetical protein
LGTVNKFNKGKGIEMGLSLIKRNKMLRGMSYLLVVFYIFTFFPVSAIAAKSKTEITHEPIEYYQSGKRIALEADISDREGINLVRLYFKSDIQAEFLFVPMTKKGGDEYKGILPAPNDTAKSITYLFLVVNNDNVVVRSQEFVARLNDDKSTPAWQKVAADDQIQLYSEIPEMTEVPAGFTDSIAMDVVESGVRFGMVVGGIYAFEHAGTAAAAGSASGASSGGAVVAGAGGMSGLGVAAAVVGVAAAGGGAAILVSDALDELDDEDEEVTEETLVGDWDITEASRTDWEGSASLYENGTFIMEEFVSGMNFSSSGNWTYNASSKYFTLSVPGAGSMGGTISGTADDFYVDGSWSSGDSGYFHWVRQ